MISMNGEPAEFPDDGEPKAAQAPREPHVITCQVCRTMWDATPAWDAGMATACPSCAKDRRIKQLEAERANLLARSGPCPNCLDLAQRVTVVEKVLRGFIVPDEFEKAWREVRGPIAPRQKLVDYGITGDTPLTPEWFATPVEDRQMHIDDFRPEAMADMEDDESGPVAAEDRFTLETLTAMGFPFSGTREEKAAWMASAPMFTGGRTAKELLDEAYIVAMSGGNPTRAVLFGGNALLGGQMDTYRAGTPDEPAPESGEDQRR